MDKESKGILDNPVVNYLPSKLEDLILPAFFKPGARETRDWFKSKMTDADFLDKGRSALPFQISKWLGLSSEKNRQRILGPEIEKNLMRLRGIKGGGDKFDKYVSDIKDEHATDRLVDVIRNVFGASHFADLDKGKSGIGMSYSRMLGHALQGGGLTAAALTLPYVNKRRMQHMALSKEDKKEDKKEKKLKKSASELGLFEQLGRSLEPNKARGLLEGPYSPWKRSPIALPLAVLAAMGAYKGTKHGILKLTDMESDRRMNKRDEKLRRELSRLMVEDNVSKEASVKEASGEKDKHGNTLSNIALPILLAMWAGMIPPFYSFGKKLGKDTSENAQYDKLMSALSSFERETPKSTKFQTGDEGSILEQRPGSFLGSRTVTLPVASRNRASAALNEIF